MHSIDYDLNLITAPATEPVTLPEMRLWLKRPDNITADNDLITSLIKFARVYVERYSKRALFTQTWELISCYSPSKIDFPLGQLQSVESVIIVAEDGTEATQVATLYSTTLDSDDGKLWLVSGQTWATTERDYDSFIVQFKCGWDDITKIPENYKTAIKQIVTGLYDDRGWTDKDSYLRCQQNAVGRLY